MERPHLPIVDAYLAGDYNLMNSIIRKTAPDDPLHVYYTALDSGLNDRIAYEHLRKALDVPPADPELFMLLLRYASSLTMHMNMSEAQRSLQLLKQLDDPFIRRELKIIATFTAEGNFLHNKGELVKAFECADEGLRQGLPEGGHSWYRMKAQRVIYGSTCGKFEIVERDLAEMSAVPELNYEQIAPLNFLKANFCCDCGKYEEGLALLDTLAEGKTESIRATTLTLRIELLLFSGRFNEGKNLLDIERDSGKKLLGNVAYEILRSVEGLTQNDLERARLRARNAIACADRSAPLTLIWCISLLVHIELSARNARVARSMLQMIDLGECIPQATIYWVRLYLLEQNPAKAAFHFKKLLDRGMPESIEGGLRYAWEVKAADVARLWATAQKRRLVDRPVDANANANAQAPNETPEKQRDELLVGQSPAMRAVKTLIGKFATVDSTVLLTGETGTGKEVIAHALHLRSRHASKPFLAVNCGAISDTLIESELFGHVKGAFTGAGSEHHGLFVAAGDGTLFLDEIEATSPRLQGALLRVLEAGEVRPVGGTKARQIHARVIAASNQPLELAIKAGTFRSDLYFRIARLHIALPPLRERIDDIPFLVEHFLRVIYGEYQISVAPELMLKLKRHIWPGNVRELKNAIELIALLAGDAKVLSADLFVPHVLLEEGSEIPPSNSALMPAVLPALGDKIAGPALKSRKGQYARLQQLRELFKDHNTLIHAEVARLIGCAAVTATRDLEVLEAEGVIRRVRGVASQRTSCFVYCGPEEK